MARITPLATPAPTTLSTLAEISIDFLFFPLEQNGIVISLKDKTFKLWNYILHIHHYVVLYLLYTI